MNDVTESGARRAVASAELVNRTRRVIRERARTMQAQKQQVRSLWIPLSISGAFLALVCFAVWSVLDANDSFANDVVSNGMPDASQQMLVFLMWCLPVSAAVLAVVWFRRMKTDGGSGR